jgi:hypothetical protein
MGVICYDDAPPKPGTALAAIRVQDRPEYIQEKNSMRQWEIEAQHAVMLDGQELRIGKGNIEKRNETMKQLIIKPNGWPCSYAECPPGLFVYHSQLCFKSEYGNDNPYLVGSGEYFCAGAPNSQRDGLEVQPCVFEWVEWEEV